MAKITQEVAKTIYSEISSLFPDAHCELNYDSDLHLLMAIMLSAQTTDASVNRVTKALFEKYPIVTDLANAELADIEALIKTLGLYKNKAKNLKALGIKIVNDFKGFIPSTQDDLESLPGVGRKTANVYLSEWHKIPRIAVDTHVKRVSYRLGLSLESDTPEKVEIKLMKLFPEHQWIEIHHKLIFFGRYFCKAKKPECKQCPLLKICKKPIL
ncbi:MAG: endonuclease III [Tenericutes bacterium HGW-Tenericutes-1]|jgi:endonuclease-3|nr:MAG: endonuclease III [Tenericutes bacterium HGW-Tenericutes-1]